MLLHGKYMYIYNFIHHQTVTANSEKKTNKPQSKYSRRQVKSNYGSQIGQTLAGRMKMS